MAGTCEVRLDRERHTGHSGDMPHHQWDGSNCVNFTEIPVNPDRSLYERYRNVIVLAGYSGAAVDGILEDWYDFYMNGDRAEFVKMLERYEQSGGDPMDDPETPEMTQEEKNRFGIR